MFVDVAKVKIKAGSGGNGALSFRHEKYIDKGGPDGGDGGDGGDVIFCGDKGLTTLVAFRYHPELKAKPGQNGSKRNKRGKSSDHLIVKVPIGTIVKNIDGTIIADITTADQVVVAKGGKGGFGNAHFKSSTRQAPRITERGEPGEEIEAILELKLLADIGLVGFPNAGKSTFLSVVSNARPEIADYAFTTLAPNLGVADIDQGSLLIADIPGLIEGASKGKGLGDAFLRHIERTSILLHLIDVYQNDIAKAYTTIRDELKTYNVDLAKKREVVALTKIDGVDEEIIEDQIKKLKTVLPKNTPVFAISAQAKQNIVELLRTLQAQVKELQQEVAEKIEEVPSIPTISLSELENETQWEVHKNDTMFIVTGSKIEKFALRTEFTNVHSVNRLRDIMRKTGISHELERQGAKPDSMLKIGNTQEFTFTEQT